MTLYHGKSTDFLEQAPDRDIPRDARILFYLDAHWNGDSPLKAEIRTILRRWPEAMMLVDDFAVPHDKGYGYDNFSSAHTLDAGYLRGMSSNLRLFYPAIQSERETGSKRGCCLLCQPASTALEVLAGNPELFIRGMLEETETERSIRHRFRKPVNVQPKPDP